jgi:hypothetical protein
VGTGAGSILNRDGTFTIVEGGAISNTAVYDPVRNTMTAGPFTTTVANCGMWAIPLAGDNDGIYRVFPGVAASTVGVNTTMLYNSISKIFSAGPNLTAIHGCGSYAFQRADNAWVTVPAQAAAGAGSSGTNILDPLSNTTLAGPTINGVVAGKGSMVIPRADGTFLIIHGNATTTTAIYIPFGGTFGVGYGIGTMGAGPAMPQAVGTAAGSNVQLQGHTTFQRPDGKWVIIVANGTSTVNTYDAGWYSDGQYISEQINVPALSANSTLEWKQSPDQFVKFEVRSATTQDALQSTSYRSVGKSGDSIGNAANDTWVQLQMNFRRTFPTYGGVLQDVYNQSAGGWNLNNYFGKVSKPTVYEFRINNGQDLINLQDNGLNVFRVTSGGNVYSGENGAFLAGGADLAENYTSTDSLTPGEVVRVDSFNPQGVLRSTGQSQQTLLGVVSTQPGFVAGSRTDNSYPIALVGRVPVRVSTENGSISIGDYLTSSSIPGYAMKATQAGRVIGKAIENFDTSIGSTQVDACPAEGMGNLPTTRCGKITMFVNLTDYMGAQVELVMAEKKNESGVTNTASGSVLDSESASIKTPSMLNQLSQTQQDILAFLREQKTKTAEKPGFGSEVYTGRLSAENEVISPLIVTDLLYAKKIKADSIEGLEILTDKISAFGTGSRTFYNPRCNWFIHIV